MADTESTCDIKVENEPETLSTGQVRSALDIGDQNELDYDDDEVNEVGNQRS